MRIRCFKNVAIVYLFRYLLFFFFSLMKKGASPNSLGGQAKKNQGYEVKAKYYV